MISLLLQEQQKKKGPSWVERLQKNQKSKDEKPKKDTSQSQPEQMEPTPSPNEKQQQQQEQKQHKQEQRQQQQQTVKSTNERLKERIIKKSMEQDKMKANECN